MQLFTEGSLNNFYAINKVSQHCPGADVIVQMEKLKEISDLYIVM